jgi:Holliday junction resolvase
MGKRFEYSVTTALEQVGFTSRRLGGTTSSLPDIAATKDDIHITLELKKTKSQNIIYVPAEQILRCFQYLKMYQLYPKKFIILSFNFLTRTKKNILANEKYMFCANRLIPYLIYNLKETGEKRHPYVFYYHMFSCNIYEETFLHYHNEYKAKERIHLPYCMFELNSNKSAKEFRIIADLEQEIDYLENTKKYMEDFSLII